MSNKYITELINNTQKTTVRGIINSVWSNIQSRRDTLSNLELMKEIVCSCDQYQIFNDYIVLSKGVLHVIFGDDVKNYDKKENYLFIPLTDTNMDYFIKTQIYYSLIEMFETYSPIEANSIYQDVFDAPYVD